MRGFSNRAFTAPRPRETEELARAIAKRFAPERPYVVTSRETISGELGKEQEIAMSWDLAKRSFAQGFRCLWNIKRVLITRAKLRVKLAYHRVMQNRVLPWVLTGWGWGFAGCGWSVALLVLVMK